ncbi:DUF6445 family protein [Aliiglaciecola sp. CAU 1673]|uniref:DUF6445 family protein n=1 Tax=Aliiglaciecola sp. CAU 1673 TaxID=3032595 RepID=UPI0023DBD73A|nr:DUF6445 family protein [Aliiglaciecola sp. CAU 1673]MDF2178789.1 DUF6445 family protein [Aliiglaciecola sp. CAU 1673]
MQESPLVTLNPDAKVSILTPGQESTPVVVMDNFVREIGPAFDDAQSLAFSAPQQAIYPGVRAPLPRAYALPVLQGLVKLIAELYQVPAHLRPRPENLFYSLVSTSPESLSSAQRIPHFDSLYPYQFAIMHYLASGPHGGTAFYRHKASGFESVTQPRYAEYRQQLDVELQESPPKSGYFKESDGYFERIEALEYRPNRLLIYPGTLLHSGLIDSATDIDENPATGRLTANLFLIFS